MSEPSPIEARARSHLVRHNLRRLLSLMDAQHRKGRLEYKHAIDDWEGSRMNALCEGGSELCDLLTYLEKAGGLDEEVFSALRTVAIALETEMNREWEPK